MNNVTITPDLGDKNEDWPFKTEKQSYQKSLGTLEKGQQQEVSFEFIQRDDVPTTRYKLKFTISADGQEETAKWFYMNTTAKPVQKDTQDNKDNKDKSEVICKLFVNNRKNLENFHSRRYYIVPQMRGYRFFICEQI